MIPGEIARFRPQLSPSPALQLRPPFLPPIESKHGQPDNVMLVPDDDGGTQVKLLDFGVAKNLSLPTAGMTTVSGALLGTPAYMAPEQIKHSANVDARSDIYAVGVMLYEALVGQRPFSGNAIELLSAQLFESVAAPSAMAEQKGVTRPQIKWPEMDRIVAKALSKDPAGRYGQVTEFLADLQTAWPKVTLPELSSKSHGASTASSGTSIPEDHRPRWQQMLDGRKRLLAGAVLVVGVTGVVALGLRNSTTRPQAKLVDERVTEVLAQPIEPSRLAQARIEQAERGSREDRRALALAIAEVGGPMPQLVTLLGDADPAVSRAALQAVASCGGRADAKLLAALQALSGRAGGALAAEVLVVRLLLGDATVEPALQAATKGSAMDPETRLRAKVALSQAGSLSASELRTVVLQMVKQGGLRPGPYRQALAELVRVRDGETTKRLTKALTDSNLRLRAEAAEVLAKAGRRDGQDALWQLAQSATNDLTFASLLAATGDSRARALLASRLADPSALVRQRAVSGLGALSVHGARPCETASVAKLLGDPDHQVGLAAAVAFLALQSCDPPGKVSASP